MATKKTGKRFTTSAMDTGYTVFDNKTGKSVKHFRYAKDEETSKKARKAARDFAQKENAKLTEAVVVKKINYGKVRKIKKMADVYKPYHLVREAEQGVVQRDDEIKIVMERWTERFADRAPMVLENVMKVLSAVQARINAGQNPLMVAPGKEQALIDLLAGVRALQTSGAGASMALKSYMQKAQSEKQGLTPEQAEIEAVRQAGAGSSVQPQVAQALQTFAQAAQSGDEKSMTEIKNDFARVYGFYQQLQARMQAARQPQGQPTPGQQAPAVSQPAPAAVQRPAPRVGTLQ